MPFYWANVLNSLYPFSSMFDDLCLSISLLLSGLDILKSWSVSTLITFLPFWKDLFLIFKEIKKLNWNQGEDEQVRECHAAF